VSYNRGMTEDEDEALQEQFAKDSERRSRALVAKRLVSRHSIESVEAHWRYHARTSETAREFLASPEWKYLRYICTDGCQLWWYQASEGRSHGYAVIRDGEVIAHHELNNRF
jgi:predicted RNA-binding Zn ribbon-like protein